MNDWVQRPLTAEDYLPANRAIALAFGATAVEDADVTAAEIASVVLERTLSVWDGAEFVGSLLPVPRIVAVPGATVPVTAVTGVAVAAPYRRRGVLRSLMLAAFEAALANGESLAGLFASEAGIYGRYGYAAAAPLGRVSVNLAQAGFGPWGSGVLAGFDGVISEHRTPDVVHLMAPLLDAVAPTRPAMMLRPDNQWARVIVDPAGERDGFTEARSVLARARTGEVRGYATFARRGSWVDNLPVGTVHVRELVAASQPVEAALWRYLLDSDLASTLTAQHRPLSDLLTHLLADARQRRIVPNEGLYLRVISVPDALSARVFSAALDLVIDVDDAFRPAGSGRWRVTVDGPDCPATVAPTDAPADLTLPITALGAAHLGTIRLSDCPGVAELTPGALVAATRAWSWHVGAWANEPF